MMGRRPSGSGGETRATAVNAKNAEAPVDPSTAPGLLPGLKTEYEFIMSRLRNLSGLR